jgi:mono/diheme cytochrome c family protein
MRRRNCHNTVTQSHFSAKFAIVKKSVFGLGRTVFYMEISSSQMFRLINKWCLSTLAAMLLVGTFSVNAQEVVQAVEVEEPAIDGGKIFSAKCATCHNPFKDGTGPKLQGVRAEWEEGAKPGSIFLWVKNWEAAAASDPYAAGVATKKTTAMDKFPNLTEPEITAIFKWVDAQTEVVIVTDDSTGTSEGGEEEGFPWIWLILGVGFLAVILAVSGVRRQLKAASGEYSSSDTMSYAEEFKAWAWKNLRFVLIGSVVIFISLIVVAFQSLYSIGVVEGYQPSQPIDFPHTTHAGINGIDCKYCHNTVTESRTAGIPTVNVCMNCHKQVSGEGDQIPKIAKIYAAAGWDGEKYTGKTKPIVWNKVHVLPDHVYFNHSQHVELGGIDCKQCHGDMTKQESTAMVQPVSELNKIEGNIQLTRSTLTMGWCIECHAEKEISTGSIDNKGDGYYMEIHRRLLNGDKELYSKYLEDGKVTVKELGGWECAKCHY